MSNEHTEGVVESDGFEVTDESIQDFIARGGEAPSFHPILKVWSEVLSNADGELNAPITPQWASRITASYRELNFADMPAFRDALFSKLVRYREIVDAVIAADDECLNLHTPEEDLEHNAGHYRDILLDWQLELLGWEMAWECTSPNAATELASLSELHKMIFGEVGITAFLDNIKFQLDQADQDAMAEALQAKKEGR